MMSEIKNKINNTKPPTQGEKMKPNENKNCPTEPYLGLHITLYIKKNHRTLKLSSSGKSFLSQSIQQQISKTETTH